MKNINQRLDKYGLSVYKLAIVVAGELFCIFSFVLSLCKYPGNAKNIIYVVATMLLLLCPAAVGLLMKFRMNSALYTFVIFYAVAPLLGSMYKLYYITNWWDKLLHCSGGVVFAILGIFLVKFLNKKNKSGLLMCAVFALCFSLALSAVWEFFEFGIDRIFGSDMQMDTYISSIDSYMLGSQAGQIGHIDGISSVVVNGQVLEGYIDIGLIDTMGDMMIEGLGALIYCIIFLIDRDRHPVITFIDRECDTDDKKNKS